MTIKRKIQVFNGVILVLASACVVGAIMVQKGSIDRQAASANQENAELIREVSEASTASIVRDVYLMCGAQQE